MRFLATPVLRGLMPKPASAMAKSPLQPTATGREWRVVCADGSRCSFRDPRAMGVAGLEIMEGMPECVEVKPNAAMPVSIDPIDSFLNEARKTGLYQRLGQTSDGQSPVTEAAAVETLQPAAPVQPPAQRCATACLPVCGDEEQPLLAVPEKSFEPQSALLPMCADANLARVVEYWPSLPLGIQAGILAMVEATIAEKAYTRDSR